MLAREWGGRAILELDVVEHHNVLVAPGLVLVVREMVVLLVVVLVPMAEEKGVVGVRACGVVWAQAPRMNRRAKLVGVWRKSCGGHEKPHTQAKRAGSLRQLRLL